MKIKALIATGVTLASIISGTTMTLASEQSDTVYTTEYLNVRSDPSLDAKKVVTLNPNSELTRIEKGEEWDAINISGNIYYVCNDYLVEEPLNENIIYVSNLGTYKLTAYCSCSICCGKWSVGGKTASGTTPSPWWTVACNSISAGTKVTINNHTYNVEDTGNLASNVIDIYMESHDDALEFGVKYADVFLIN